MPLTYRCIVFWRSSRSYASSGQFQRDFPDCTGRLLLRWTAHPPTIGKIVQGTGQVCGVVHTRRKLVKFSSFCRDEGVRSRRTAICTGPPGQQTDGMRTYSRAASRTWFNYGDPRSDSPRRIRGRYPSVSDGQRQRVAPLPRAGRRNGFAPPDHAEANKSHAAKSQCAGLGHAGGQQIAGARASRTADW